MCYGGYFEVNIASITGSDSTFFLPANNADLVTFDFTTFNSNTSTLDVGTSDDGASFVTVSVSGVTFPITLTKVTYTKTARGYTRNRVAFQADGGRWSGTYIAFTITKNSTTAGVLKVWY